MARRKNINWKIDGVDVDPKLIKVQAKAAFDYEAMQAATKIAGAIDEQIAQLNANSSNRGVGFLAARYNKPFEDAYAVVEDLTSGSGSEFKIYVPSEGKGTPGYKFNVLDQGSPGSDKEQTFPIYDGQLTNVGSVDLNVGNVQVKKPTKWYHGPSRGFPARNMLKAIKDNAKEIIKKPSKRRSNSPVDNLDRLMENAEAKRGPFRFKYDPTNVKVRMGKARR